MKRFLIIFSAVLIVLSCAETSFAKRKISSEKLPHAITVVEIPNDIGWLKGKKIFCDSRKRFVTAADNMAGAEKVLSKAISWNEKIRRYFNAGNPVQTPILILLTGNKNEFKAFSRQEHFQGVSISVPKNGVLARLIILPYSKEGLEDILPHELVHHCVMDISNSKVRKKDFKHPAPLCINEGIAENFVSEREKKKLKEFCRLFSMKDGFMPLEKLLAVEKYSSNISDIARFYCQSFSLVDYILSLPDGKKNLVKYIQLYEHSRENPYELFKEVFCVKSSSGSFQKGWTRHVTRNYAPRGQLIAKKKVKKSPGT